MDGTQILTLGLGLQAPGPLKEQHLDKSALSIGSLRRGRAGQPLPLS